MDSTSSASESADLKNEAVRAPGDDSYEMQTDNDRDRENDERGRGNNDRDHEIGDRSLENGDRGSAVRNREEEEKANIKSVTDNTR